MTIIMPEYQITERTLAILPGKHTDYQAIVIETEEIYKVALTPLQIIKQGCIDGWSSYEGRKDGVLHHTDFKQKLPIPINLRKGYYAFPTHSPEHMDCHWIFLNQILRITPDGKNTTLLFTNGYRLELDVSYHTIQRQFERALYCQSVIEMD